MATRKLSLIMELRDHQKIVAALRGLSSDVGTMAQATRTQRQEVDALEASYRKLQASILSTVSAASKLTGVPAGAAGGRLPALGGGQGAGAGAGTPALVVPGVSPGQGMVPAGTSGGGKGSGLRLPSGPYQRQAQLQSQIQSYMANPGTQEQGQDLRLSWEANQKQMHRLENPPKPKTRMDLLKEAVMTSRFGANGIQPLVGRSIAAITGGAEAGAAGGPVGLVAMAAMAAAQQLYKVAEASARATHQFMLNQTVSGGSAYESARLASLGIGAEASRGILARITEGGPAQGVAAKLGVTATPGPYGTMNSADATLKLVEGLRRESGEQQRRDMRILGMEGFAGLLKISDNTFNLLKRDSLTTARIMSPARQKQAEEFNTSQDRLGQAGKNLLNSLDGPLIQDLTAWQNGIATGMNTLAEFFAKNQAAVSNVWHTMRLLFDPGAAIGQWLQEQIGGKTGGKNTDEEQLDQSKEMNDNLRRLNHTFQRSEKANRATPAALSGVGLHKALMDRAVPRGNV